MIKDDRTRIIVSMRPIWDKDLFEWYEQSHLGNPEHVHFVYDQIYQAGPK